MFVIIIHYAVCALVIEWREWLCLFKANKTKRRGKLLNHITCHVSQKLKQPFWPLPPYLYMLSISFSTYRVHVYNAPFHCIYIWVKIHFIVIMKHVTNTTDTLLLLNFLLMMLRITLLLWPCMVHVSKDIRF